MSAEDLGDGSLAGHAVRAQHHAGRRGPRPRRARWRRSLLSTHPVLTIEGGRFVSPLEAPEAESVNTFPVLATEDDDALLGAAIMLPDHPRLAPESRGDLFDGTEIEEALLLHVLALSDDEREAIAAADPAVRRWSPAPPPRRPRTSWPCTGARRSPTPRRRTPSRRASARSRSTASPTGCGAKAVLRLGDRSDPYDRILDGRMATIERIYYDYEDKLYFGVTVDDDPGQQLMRDTGRYHFFFLGELEVCGT